MKNNLIKTVNGIRYVNIKDILRMKGPSTLEEIVTILNNNDLVVIGLYFDVNKRYKSIYEDIKDLEENNLKVSYQDLLFKIYASDKDINIRNELVNLNLSLIYYVINNLKMMTYNDVNDLFEIGCIGLIKAVEKFDITKNVKFSSYAFLYVRGNILRYLYTQYNLPHDYVIELVKEKRKLNNSGKLFETRNDYLEEAVENADVSLNKSYEKTKKQRKVRINISNPINYSELDKDYLVEYNMDRNIDYDIFSKKLKQFLDSLSEEKRGILISYFDLDNKHLSIQEITDLYNINRKKIYHTIYSLKEHNNSKAKNELARTVYDSLFSENGKILIKK